MSNTRLMTALGLCISLSSTIAAAETVTADSSSATTDAASVSAVAETSSVAATPVAAASAPSSTVVAVQNIDSASDLSTASSVTSTDGQADTGSAPTANKNVITRSIDKTIDKIGELGTKIAVDATAAQPDPVKDPFEGFNRSIFKFNSKLDKYILLPVAGAYSRNVPQPVQTAISQFFSNLGTPWTAVNNLLQGHPGTSIESLSRFIINTSTTLGFYDVAGYLGVEKSSGDFGQTLGKWGIGSGPFLMLPFLGPSTVRDTFGTAVDQFGSPIYYVNDGWTSAGLTAVKTVDMRAKLIGLEHFVEGDQYSLLRDVYLQNRQFKINGKADSSATNSSFSDDGFGDDSNSPSTTSPDAPNKPAKRSTHPHSSPESAPPQGNPDSNTVPPTSSASFKEVNDAQGSFNVLQAFMVTKPFNTMASQPASL
ncbi:MlaA family lipoprotein [Aquirhabdus parva]|uniref:VacJ family lipoprotein n=1 Tax=Aquirhabdus parva TaxID=2283318 RepID=A0A345P2N9_9GAMM|nr:VacJ family lipoprotein [Aquirhabdus parva]AXI01548.1 hypothetical protein HYN46_00720 [Aquirhabdus parva]